MVETYLSLKIFLESFFLGPGIFWILFIAFLCLYRSKSPKRKRNAEKTTIASLLLIILLVSPPFLEVVSLPLYFLTPENTNIKTDAIVSLGAGISNTGYPTQSSTERAYIASKLFLQGRSHWLIFSTGNTNKNIKQSEAYGMRIIALGLGVPENKIILEEKSYNTNTNALEIKKILLERNLKSITLVTSSCHLYRAFKTFKKIGINVYPYSSSIDSNVWDWKINWHRPLKFVEILHEYFALVIYKIKGWI